MHLSLRRDGGGLGRLAGAKALDWLRRDTL
ncbi:MAG: hypothetical protein QOJ64_1432 [Acidobacteriota bacterium]|jgi:hypothetical protein|nr:hypothetical protein [Acidobacteriota bacterium]